MIQAPNERKKKYIPTKEIHVSHLVSKFCKHLTKIDYCRNLPKIFNCLFNGQLVFRGCSLKVFASPKWKHLGQLDSKFWHILKITKILSINYIHAKFSLMVVLWLEHHHQGCSGYKKENNYLKYFHTILHGHFYLLEKFQIDWIVIFVINTNIFSFFNWKL